MDGARRSNGTPASPPHGVLVVGLPRGATTWVGRTLGQTEGARYVHEPDGTHDPYGFVAKRSLLYHPVLDPAAPLPEPYRALWAGVFAGGRHAHSWRDRLARRAYRRVTPAQKSAARNGGPVSVRLRVVTWTAQPLAPDPGVRHVVAKSVNAAFAVEALAAAFGVQVAVVLRHPLDVVASWRDFGWEAPGAALLEGVGALARRRWGVDAPAADDPPLERAVFLAGCMTVSFEDALAAHPEWVRIAHEVVCTDPVRHLHDAADRLGLRWNETAEQFVIASDRPGEGYATARVASEQAGRWRTRLDADEVSRATGVLARFGHPSLGID